MSSLSPNLLSTISKTFCITVPHCLILLQRCLSMLSLHPSWTVAPKSHLGFRVKTWTTSSTGRTLLPGFLTLVGLWLHITSTLIHHHWLPVKFCVYYKLLLLTYLSLHALKPHYVADVLLSIPRNYLHSDIRNSLILERFKLHLKNVPLLTGFSSISFSLGPFLFYLCLFVHKVT